MSNRRDCTDLTCVSTTKWTRLARKTDRSIPCAYNRSSTIRFVLRKTVDIQCDARYNEKTHYAWPHIIVHGIRLYVVVPVVLIHSVFQNAVQKPRSWAIGFYDPTSFDFYVHAYKSSIRL